MKRIRRSLRVFLVMASADVSQHIVLAVLPFAAAVFFFKAATELYGAPIYSQAVPSDPVAALGSQDFPNAHKVADSFLIHGSEPTTIRSIRFIGGYGLRNPPPITPPIDALPSDNFRISFFADADGIPGLPITGGDFSVDSTFARTPTGGPLLNEVFSPIEYIINLGEGVDLSPETTYWLAIINDSGPLHGWLWATANDLFDQELATTFDDVAVGPWVVHAGGMYFELNDETIPEPTVIVILLTAVLSALFSRGWRSIANLGENRSNLLAIPPPPV